MCHEMVAAMRCTTLLGRNDRYEAIEQKLARRVQHGRRIARRLALAFGEEFTAPTLLTRVELGPSGLCYRNASVLVMQRPDLTYAEGFAHTDGGFTVMHAWAVDAAGNVVDPTWGSRGQFYFGVRYDREKYLQHIDRVQCYGVATNSTFTVAQRIRPS